MSEKQENETPKEVIFMKEVNRISSTYGISQFDSAIYIWNYNPIFPCEVCCYNYNSPCKRRDICKNIFETDNNITVEELKSYFRKVRDICDS